MNMGRRRKQENDIAPPHDPLCVYNTRLARVDLAGLWQNNAAFLVLGGPSVNRYRPEVFAERGVLSLGVNNVAGKIRCSAFVCADPPQKFHHGIWFDGRILKFVPRCKAGASRGRIRTKVGGRFDWAPVGIRDCPSVFFFDRAEDLRPELFLTSPAAFWGTNKEGSRITGRPRLLFTPFLGIRLLWYLGVREIYCVGLDFRMSPTEQYCFEQGRDAGAIRANNNLYRSANKELAAIKPTLDEAGLKVFNCSAESGCPVFPFVPFETALRRVRGATPPEPFDLLGWYESKDHTGTLEEILAAKAAKDEAEKGEKRTPDLRRMN